MKRAVGLTGLVVVAVTLTACAATSDGKSEGGAGSLTLAAITPPTSYDPGAMPLGGPETPYYETVYDSLLNLDADGEEVANLATEWTYDEALTSLSLTLRDDVTFSDGARFDADAVKANIEATKAGTGATAQAFRFVDRVDVTDATHAVITLSAPDPALEANLARTPGYMVSPQAIGTPALATAPVGSGPYILDTEATTPNDVYVYTRNPDYWNEKAYPFDSVSVRYIDDYTAILNALRTGQLDGAPAPSAEAVSGAEQAGLTVSKYINGAIEGVFLWDRNGALAPALADVRVRQAINYATDRDTIVKTVKGGLGTVTVQPFAPVSGANDPALDEMYPFDLDKAKKLMAEAGYADGFQMTLPDFSPVFPDEQAAMNETFASLNIAVTYEPITGDQAVGNIIQGRYPANYFNLSSSNAWDLAQLTMAQAGAFNPFHADDPKAAELLAAVQNSAGEQQAAALRDLNEHVTEQAWFALWDFQLGAFSYGDRITVEPIEGTNVPPLYQFAPAK